MKSKSPKKVSSKGIEKIQLEVLMKPKARRDAAGLNKLSANQLRSLNQWLNGHRELLGPVGGGHGGG
jgi:hypothetical protein